MNLLFRIIFPSLLCLLVLTNAYSQYFTVKGKQLYDENGQPFYPVTLPWVIHVIHKSPPVFPYTIPHLEPTASDLTDYYYIAPNYHNGSHDYYECTDEPSCFQALVDELYKMKDMGFNTLRIAGIVPSWNRNGDLLPDDNFYYIMSQKNFQGSFWAENDYIRVTTPYNTSPILNFIFDKLDALLAVATAPPLNFKLLIETANGSTKMPAGFAGNYEELLEEWIDHFKTNPAVIAYVIISEPQWSEEFDLLKSEVCSLTTGWYDFIKDPLRDPNHLISTAGSIIDILSWDPTVIKSDLYEVHPYFNLQEWEKEETPPYARDIAINRSNNILYWLSNHCPKPWYMGEIGFKSWPVPIPYNPLDYDGTESDQADFAEQTYLAALNCGASGYGWWNYQDEWTFDYTSLGWPPEGEGFGLLKHGDIPSTPPDFYDKEAVAVFKDFKAFPPTPSACTMPATYPDPYNCGVFNSSHNNAVTGRIIDINGNGIPGGVVEAQSWLYTDFHDLSDPNDDEYFKNWYHYYADGNGNFEAIPYNNLSIGDDRIIGLEGSAPGAEMFASSTGTDAAMLPLGNVPLEYFKFKYDDIVDGETINQNNTKNFKAWNSLIVSNTTIDGTSDITARQEINVNSLFNASVTSAVHIYISETFIDCNEISAFRLAGNTSSGTQPENNKLKEIEINFTDNQEPGIAIIPNPNQGTFVLEIYNSGNMPATVSIKNPLGNELKKFNTTQEKISLDLHTFSKGIYFIEVVINNNRIIKKIIIN